MQLTAFSQALPLRPTHRTGTAAHRSASRAIVRKNVFRQQRAVSVSAQETDAPAEASQPQEEGLITFGQVLADFKEAAAAGPVNPETANGFAGSVENELADLQAALEQSSSQAADLEGQLTKLNDQFLRLNADFDNFRKRTAAEKESLTSSTRGELIQALLPVIDNFELAKAQLKLETDGEKKVDASYQGVYRQMVDLFRGFGLEVVPGEGAPFDPEVHEAIMREESNDVADGTVLQEFRKGFKLGDKLLRPAMVKVSFREEANGSAAASGGASNEAEKEQATA